MSDREKLARARRDATFSTMKLVFRVGKTGIAMAAFGAFVLAYLFSPLPAYFPLVFCVVFPVVLFVTQFGNYRAVWRSHVVKQCQFAGLWDTAEKMLLEDGGEPLRQLLEGRIPNDVRDYTMFKLVLSGWRVLAIRKGHMRQVYFITQYVSSNGGREYDQNVYLVYLGKYEKAVAGLHAELDEIIATNRKYSVAYFLNLMATLEMNVALRRVTECDRLMLLVKDAYEQGVSKANAAKDQESAAKADSEHALYWKYLGRTCLLKQQFAEAEVAFQKAEAVIGTTHLILFVPELLIFKGEGLAEQGRFVEAEQELTRALNFYHEHTVYRGSMYVLAQSWLAICQLKQDLPYDLEAASRALVYLENEVELVHPRIATVLIHLAEVHRKNRRFAEEKEVLERALGISRRLFGPNDPQVLHLEQMLQAPSREPADMTTS